MMHWKVDAIHRALHRLEALGYFQNKIPFLHGIVTFSESLVKRTFNPTLPEHEDLLMKAIQINLIRDELHAESKAKEKDFELLGSLSCRGAAQERSPACSAS